MVNYLRQLISLVRYEEANMRAMTKGFLILGGATDLKKGKAGWYAVRSQRYFGKAKAILVSDFL